VARFASAVGAAAASGTRALGAVETSIEVSLALVLFGLAAVGFVWPTALAYPFAALGTWLGITLMLRAHRNRKQRQAELSASIRRQLEKARECRESPAGEQTPY
jgi:cardiolipin synthase